MWPRIAEILLGGWLAASPWALSPTAGNSWPWINDMSAGLAIVVLAALSFFRPLGWAHLLEIPVGLWLLGFAFLASPPSAAAQNEILVALVLLMFAIIPNEASRPARSWREFEASRRAAKTTKD
jgi:hypothetical protein